MTMQSRCPHCQSVFRVPDGAVGKKTKCSKCQRPFTVAAMVGLPTPAGEQWTARAPDGQDYGPVAKAELDGWVTEGRVTNEWQLLKEGSGQWQWAYDVYESLLPSAVTIQTDAPSTTSTSPATTKHIPTLRVRKYPAMRFVSYFFYGLAVLTALSLVLSLIGIAMMVGGGMMAGAQTMGTEFSEAGGAMAGTSAMFGIFMFVMSVLYHGTFIALFVYAAESVRIVLDIQQNTQETAHYTRYGFA